MFVRTQRGADRVAEQLREAGVIAGALHGGLTQGARTRILEAFKEGSVPVLVATDVAARGIHVDDVGLVLQVDPPAGPKDYLHRAGRTARAGGTGVVVSLVLPHQRREVTRLLSQAAVTADHLVGTPGDEELGAVTGGRQPSCDAVSRGRSSARSSTRRPAVPWPPSRWPGRSPRWRPGRPPRRPSAASRSPDRPSAPLARPGAPRPDADCTTPRGTHLPEAGAARAFTRRSARGAGGGCQ